MFSKQLTTILFLIFFCGKVNKPKHIVNLRIRLWVERIQLTTFITILCLAILQKYLRKAKLVVGKIVITELLTNLLDFLFS